MEIKYIVNSNQYKTIKEVLKNHFHMSDRLILKLKRSNQIYLNKSQAPIYSPINLNDIIQIDLNFNEVSKNIVPIKIPLEIVFEDDAMLIVNKPAFVPIHPSMAHFEDSLSNGVQYYFKENNIKSKIHIVNRLDKNTSRPCHIR